MHQAHDDRRVGLVLVGFSPADRLAALSRHLRWPGRVLADPDRLLYHRLQIGRASWWRVYSPATLAIYARAVGRRQPLAKPVEDTRQLGGDAITVGPVVRRLWRPRSPDDRPPAHQILAMAGRLADTTPTTEPEES